MRGNKPKNPKVQDIVAGRRDLTVHEGGAAKGGGGGDRPAPPPPPAAPDWIKDDLARKLWSRAVPELMRRKQYLHLFEYELGRYCVAFGEYVKANDVVEEFGMVVKSPNGYPIQSPYVSIRNRAHEIMRGLATDLGLNPVAQVRLDGVQLDMFADTGAPVGGTPSGTGPPEGTFAKFRAVR